MMIEASKLFGLRRDAGLLQRLGLSPEFTDDALGQRAASSSRLLSARTNAKSSRVAVRSVAVSRVAVRSGTARKFGTRAGERTTLAPRSV